MTAEAPPPPGPWRQALRGLLRNRAAMVAFAVLALITLSCALAPLYARDIARTDPFTSNVAGSILLGRHEVDIMQPNDNPLHLGLSPIGPTGHAAYLLGADSQGRDVAARLLYGGRNSLLIAACAAVLCLLLAAAAGIAAGFFGGLVDVILSRLMDIMWAVPVYLFAISLSIVTVSQGLKLGPFVVEADSLLIPIVIIALVYVPYAARPIRGRVLALRQAEFVTAARCLGVPRWRIVLFDILPNVTTTLVVLGPLLMALSLLAESALSFLSIGVQAPAASWGTIIQDGEGLIYTRPMVAIAPGLAIVLVVLALNILGDGLRDALDVRDSARRSS
ncbi:ABC transporter permease [Acetobacter orleanensis]|uniref:Peptide ABC transporter permease n=1 Tax=Acetobacter orleanensis TaxID=104099 RepID=A0A4Y3TLL6_9PROT|nr:ABC transporter permease [Acetobacter orleanensis]KXV65383.1 peptide ABC transporter permease [Acetobacter orleanensis]PCD80146.1 ABC transporter permease [Acetobacter orleanensis]GAN68541.1 ABC transporter oligopeptide permease OppC [Acetobacter orleanensis JCM 7639]GBR22951.1 peptide ABC transporter permease [Acetobacter orleanensis NRIC 0473]GEB82654.1 peptide ABC transporter permease [Acetobacter orleanensis]